MIWIDACGVEDISPEDLISINYEGQILAIYHGPDGKFYCTSGLCTHESVNLADGLVMGFVIECPRHNGQFDYRTGQALRTPACEQLKTYAIKLERGRVLINLVGGDTALK